MTTRDPLKKEMATEKKEDRVAAAEMDKRAAKAQHAAAKQGGATTGTGYGATGTNTTFQKEKKRRSWLALDLGVCFFFNFGFVVGGGM